MYLPFSDVEWKILEDTDGLWEAIQIQSGLQPSRTFRVQLDRDRIMERINDEWDLRPTSTISKTLCFGSVMNAFEMYRR